MHLSNFIAIVINTNYNPHKIPIETLSFRIPMQRTTLWNNVQMRAVLSTEQPDQNDDFSSFYRQPVKGSCITSNARSSKWQALKSTMRMKNQKNSIRRILVHHAVNVCAMCIRAYKVLEHFNESGNKCQKDCFPPYDIIIEVQFISSTSFSMQPTLWKLHSHSLYLSFYVKLTSYALVSTQTHTCTRTRTHSHSDIISMGTQFMDK